MVRIFSVKKTKIINVNDFNYSRNVDMQKKGQKIPQNDRSSLLVVESGKTLFLLYTFQFC